MTEARSSYSVNLRQEQPSSLRAIGKIALAFVAQDPHVGDAIWVVEIRELIADEVVASHRHPTGPAAEADLASIEAALDALSTSAFETAYGLSGGDPAR